MTTEIEVSSGISKANSSIEDPYFLANSDSPTASLVAVLFSGGNFLRWKKNVLRALGAKNKIGFVDGSILEPDSSDAKFVKWKRCDLMVSSWIYSSMKSNIVDDFQYAENAAELWSELNERFGQSNGPLIYQLMKEIANLKQDNLSILTYYGKIKRLWDEMQNFHSLPTCTCGVLKQCSCNFLKRLLDFDNEEKLMQFLLGLNSGFDTSTTQILTQDPLPTINKAYSMLQQIEKQKEICGTLDLGTKSSAMASQRFSKPSVMPPKLTNSQSKTTWQREKNSRFCDHCKVKGHTIDQCFKLIGYPDWYTAIQGSIKPSGKLGRTGPKMAAHVDSAGEVQDTPFDSPKSSVDPVFLASVCQEVMKAIKASKWLMTHMQIVQVIS
ncbi:unnamed protein product [Amaranthus hypochondriacus]